jgi:hypothetical protein
MFWTFCVDIVVWLFGFSRFFGFGLEDWCGSVAEWRFREQCGSFNEERAGLM